MNRITPENKAKAEQLIDEIIQNSGAVGLAACIIDTDGNTEYELYRGVRDTASAEAPDGETIFGLASVTKSMTAAGILQLADEGILSLNDPVSRYIPEFTNRHTETVTIAHLLSHAGGFFPQSRITVDMVQKNKDTEPAYDGQLTGDAVKLVAERLDALTAEHGLLGRPGEYFSYCNDGFGLLSEIIHRCSGSTSYAQRMHDSLFAPLGMTRTSMEFIAPANDENAAVLYRKKDGVLYGDRNYRDNAFALHGGGAAKSCMNDMKKYLGMWLNEGRSTDGVRVLSEYSVREAVKPRQPYDLCGTYGYGLSCRTCGPFRIFGHGGSLPGVSSNIAFCYDAGCAVIILCNTSGIPVSAVSGILFRMYAGMDPEPERVTCTVPWPQTLIDAVCGTYASDEGTTVEIYRCADGSPGLREDGEEKTLITCGERTAIVRNPYTETVVRPVFSEQRGYYAVLYGSRIIPRV